ncbi:MAG: transcriptional regulator, MarR family [Nocardioidaceae bacterium]|nr:transcriptional regulator, MarR family [Nocardioidaceae bacterium]
MTSRQEPDPRRSNTIAMLGQAYSLLGFRIVDGVVGSGHPIKPSHSAVFAQIRPGGSRLTELAAGANMTPQSMGQIVDELEQLGYVERQPDPSDRRAKLIVLTAHGRDAVDAGESAVSGLEEDLDRVLGTEGAEQLRTLLGRILAAGQPPERP